MTDIRDLNSAEIESVPADVSVTFSKYEFIVVCRQLAAIGGRDHMRPDAKSAFAKLIRAAQERVKGA